MAEVIVNLIHYIDVENEIDDQILNKVIKHQSQQKYYHFRELKQLSADI